MKSGITRRWLRGSLLITIVAVAVAEAVFVYLFSQNYYGSVRQAMVTRFSAMTGQLQMYSGDTEDATAAARSLALRHMVEQFSDKDKYEFMLLDAYGSVIATSSGTSASGIVSSKDFENAQRSSSNVGSASYTTATGERVMSVCVLVPYAAQDVAALRLVTSLTLVDEQVQQIVSLSVLIAIAILSFSVLSGVYFVRSIVNPLGAMEKTAASIAEGDLDVRLPAKGDARDEVDRLSVSINRMAEGLAKTEQMKNEFISSVSHELRTPLTSIKGWVETMETIHDPTDENYRKGLAIIGSETDRLYNMVEELLDFSRLQNGRLTIHMQPLDLVAETTDAVLFLEPRCDQNGLVLDYTEPEDMIPVQADTDRLRQVFINVMDNAVKYSVPGGKITVKLWAGEKNAFVEIIDQGRGIPPEDLENVKAKFYKGRNSVRGSGIGLALVDEIMSAMNGSLDLHSTLGKGTVVTLGLPLYRKEKATEKDA
jgi:signal transduction histidine kinase